MSSPGEEEVAFCLGVPLVDVQGREAWGTHNGVIMELLLFKAGAPNACSAVFGERRGDAWKEGQSVAFFPCHWQQPTFYHPYIVHSCPFYGNLYLTNGYHSLLPAQKAWGFMLTLAPPL